MMSSTPLAPRPARSNWGRVIYNVLQDAPINGLTAEQVWDKVPISMHVPHSRGKFTGALHNMAHRGYLVSAPIMGVKRTKRYKIAPRSVYERSQADLKKRYGTNHKKKAKSPRVEALAGASKGFKDKLTNGASQAGNRLVTTLDFEIDMTNTAIEKLYARKKVLQGMRIDARKL